MQKSKVTIEIGVNGFELHNYHYTLSRLFLSARRAYEEAERPAHAPG